MAYAVILFVVLAVFVAVGYYLNSKTEKPEGCEDMSEKCEGCRITSCINHPSNH